MNKQTEIFIAFFRPSIVGFGGGPATIPLVHKEVVETYGFMTDEEFTDILAIGNTLPGPIITKMAGYIGYRVGGMLGLINAVLATILPSAIMLVLLLTLLNEYKDLPFIIGMTNGVVPIVGVMMAVLTWNYFSKSQKSLGWKLSGLILGISFITIILLNIHPGIVVIALLLFALLLPVKRSHET